jgi:hypothetical protein
MRFTHGELQATFDIIWVIHCITFTVANNNNNILLFFRFQILYHIRILAWAVLWLAPTEDLLHSQLDVNCQTCGILQIVLK